MDFSFVIRTLNEGKYIGYTLKKIQELNDSFSKEVIIVDAGSTDNTIEIAKSYGCKIVHIDKSEWSWGKSLNLGIENAKGKFITIISGHCFITKPDFLINAYEFLLDKNVAGVYGRQIPIPGLNPFEEFFREQENIYPDIEVFVMTKNTKQIGISNACSIIKRSVWEKIPYNEEVQSLEDGIWAKEVLNAGYKLIYTNRLSVYHSHEINFIEFYKRQYWFVYELLRNNPKKLFIKKLLYNEYILLKSYFLKKKLIKFLKRKSYRVDENLINDFMYTIKLASQNAFSDFINKRNFIYNYNNIKIPDKVLSLQNKYKIGNFEIYENISKS